MTQSKPLAYSYIRMSTDMQLKGHSRQRQLDGSAAYVKQHGLQLVEDGQFEDIGVSAFKGANVDYGALGVFLTALDQGVIPKGSYLIVESLDRLSRQPVRKSLELFLRIINSGVNLVTLDPEPVEFPAEGNIDETKLIVAIIAMSRSNQESATKGTRVSKSWANKRAHAASNPITAMAPAWLQLNKEKRRFEKIAERVAVVRLIFADTVAGIGTYVIANRLNRKKIPTFGHVTTRKKALIGKSRGWYRSSVAAIITNRAVIGEYQPCKMVDVERQPGRSERQPDGDPIKDYFPRIISDELFYRAQEARRERRVSGRGRKGKYVTNLFSTLRPTCAYCHSRMAFENKGAQRGTYFVCEAAKRGSGCGVRKGWRYEDFEISFLTFVHQLNLEQLIRNDDSQIKALDESSQGLEGQLQAIEADMEKLLKLLQKADVEFLSRRFVELQRQQDEIKALLEAKRAERHKLRLAEDDFYKSKDEIKSLVRKFQDPTVQGQKDLYRLRSQLSARIKSLVATLEIAPVGTEPIMKKLIKDNKAIAANAETKREFVESIKASAHTRYCNVTFNGGNQLRMLPHEGDPYALHRLVETVVD
jgi:DNA invertase Pin-like site-specific DNA recombinase